MVNDLLVVGSRERKAVESQSSKRNHLGPSSVGMREQSALDSLP